MKQAKPLLRSYQRFDGEFTSRERQTLLLHIMKKTGIKARQVAEILNVKDNTVRIWRMTDYRTMITYRGLVDLYNHLGYDLITGELKEGK